LGRPGPFFVIEEPELERTALAFCKVAISASIWSITFSNDT
jgi:hypothetical protein